MSGRNNMKQYSMNNGNEITLAITGASGTIYAVKLLKELLLRDQQVHLMISDAAKVVFATELEIRIPKNSEAMINTMREVTGIKDKGTLRSYAQNDWMSVVASGSSSPEKMVVCPCSTGTLSAIATGASNNLIERAADVNLKEKGQLVLVTREMPLSAVHLENMLKLSRLGVSIMPASPGFYHHPETIDDLVNFVVARVLEHLGFNQNICSAWGY